MECERYDFIFKNMMSAYAFHRIILDKDNNPIDYEYVEVNKSFEDFVGIKSENIIGKRVTELFPGIKDDTARWVERYGKIAMTGGSEYFEDFSQVINKWFQVNAFSTEEGFFVTIFNDVTGYKEKEKALSDKIKELEKMNKIMMERELKMVEMKKEIKDLEAKNTVKPE